MDEPEKPLHVQVAEALGCRLAWRKPYRGSSAPAWCCECESWKHWDPNPCEPWADNPEVARFDLDWAATGPLVERLKINLERAQAAREDGGPVLAWRWSLMREEKAWGDTELLAICKLILALHAAGKLKEVA